MGERKLFWLILVLWSGFILGLLYLTGLIAPFEFGTGRLNFVEQGFYALVLAPYPAFLVFWVFRKIRQNYAFQRLLLNGASFGLIVFVLQIMLFALFEATADFAFPQASILFNSDLAHQISTYSRIPILSQFVGMYMFLAAYVSRCACPTIKPLRPILIGLVYYIPYLIGFYLANLGWDYYFTKLLAPPNKINLLLIFIHWIPTVYFLILTYIYSAIRKK